MPCASNTKAPIPTQPGRKEVSMKDWVKGVLCILALIAVMALQCFIAMHM